MYRTLPYATMHTKCHCAIFDRSNKLLLRMRGFVMFRPAATKTGKKLFRPLKFHRMSAAVALRTIKTRNCLPFAMTSNCVGVVAGNVKQRN